MGLRLRMLKRGVAKFYCAICEERRGGFFGDGVGFRCTNAGCGFMFCDVCGEGGVLDYMSGESLACPRCGNPGERAVN